MWRYFTSIALVLGLGIILFPQHPSHPKQPGPEVYSVKYETTAKKALLDQDVKLTDDLCRSQCSIDYAKMLSRIDTGEPAQQVLAEMKTAHEKMDMLIWSKRNQPFEQGIKVGELPTSSLEQATDYLKAAKSATDAGQHYQSPKFGEGKHIYFVQGLPSAVSGSTLIGVIHQDILYQVTDHQMKNLRLEALSERKPL
ncbi:hypothetical protein [Paenibacillus sp. N3.4]|uniref:hypothetical protein n=1 Tax=Paenibacillus sp. N3.4 TaxID=2603222 RepID=UPI0021C49F14|nr:hypothetical protein [Paenibacillus sp. N3.4]